jgi:hypothetical protein
MFFLMGFLKKAPQTPQKLFGQMVKLGISFRFSILAQTLGLIFYIG